MLRGSCYLACASCPARIESPLIVFGIRLIQSVPSLKKSGEYVAWLVLLGLCFLPCASGITPDCIRHSPHPIGPLFEEKRGVCCVARVTRLVLPALREWN